MLTKALRFCEILGTICLTRRNMQEGTNRVKLFSGEAGFGQIFKFLVDRFVILP